MGLTRRKFIECSCKSLSLLTMASAFRRFGLMNAYAQGVNDYKALVCVFLFGGNDGNNMVIPITTSLQNFSAYNAIRGGTSIGLAQANLLPITTLTGAQQYGLHPVMTEIQTLFGSGRLAVLANAGPIVKPTTRTQYLAKSVPLPTNLFSHSDQQNEWQTAQANSLSVVGWGGRIADVMSYANSGSQYPTMVSTAGTAPFTNGQQTSPVNLIAQNPQNGISPPVTGVACSAGSSASSTQNCNNRTNAMQQLLTFDTGASLVQEASNKMSESFLYTNLLNNARIGYTAMPVTWPSGSFANQLRQVAEIIQVRSALGMNRQIFFVSLGGFDTHSAQGTVGGTGVQPTLLQQLSQGLKAFDDAMTYLTVQNSVTTFTLSDFGRTLQPNTSAGSDHAWGNHQFIMGGAVHGQELYGQYPALSLSGPNDSSNNGRWIPTTSIDQYGATLASWFGVDSGSLPAIFPNLPNFTTQNLGFLS